MLDAFGIGSCSKKVQKAAADELQASSPPQRRAHCAERDAHASDDARPKLIQAQKVLEQVEKTAAGTMGHVDELGRRLTSLDERTKAMEDVEKKIKN